MLSELHDRFRIRKDKTDPRRLAYLCLILFASPSVLELSIGSVLAVLGILLHGWAAGYLARAGNASREAELTISGPYLHTRNPYYVAHMIMDLGLFLAAGLLALYPVYILYEFSVYRSNVLSEEQFLLNEFGDKYRAYMEKVPRWFFRLTPASVEGASEPFTWHDYLLNDELKRTLSHIGILTLFWLILFFGNWFTHLPLLGRLTIVLTLTTWLLLRDARLQPESDPSVQPIWLMTGLLILGLGVAALVIDDQFWHLFPPPYRSVSVLLGGVFALVSIGRHIPVLYKRWTDFFDDLFPVANLNYLVFFYSAGLLTVTLGGLWIALLLSILIWSIEAALGRRMPWPKSLLGGLT